MCGYQPPFLPLIPIFFPRKWIHINSLICQVVWLYHLWIVSCQGSDWALGRIWPVSCAFIFISLHTYLKRKLFTCVLPWFLLPWQPRSYIAKMRERERPRQREREKGKKREWELVSNRIEEEIHRPPGAVLLWDTRLLVHRAHLLGQWIGSVSQLILKKNKEIR